MKRTASQWIRILAQPVVLMLSGLVLMGSPDMITVVVTKALSILLFFWGLWLCLQGLSHRKGLRLIGGLVLVILGSRLLQNPLALARICGITLGINVLSDHLRSFRQPVTVCTAVVALVLIFMPLTLARFVFFLLGLLLLGMGATLLYSRLRHPRSPDIIDAL